MISTGLFVLYKVTQGVSLFTAAHRTYQVAQSDMPTSQKAHRVATEVIFGVAQGFSVGISLADAVSTAKVVVDSAAAGAAVLKNVSEVSCKPFEWGNLLEVGACVLFRTGMTVTGIIVLEPEVLGNHAELVEWIADLTNSSSLMVNPASRDKLIYGGTKLCDAVKYLTGYIKENREPSATQRIVVRMNKSKIPELMIDPHYASLMKTVIESNSIADFAKIPDLFKYDKVLKSYICSLSRKPIRHVLMVAGTEKKPVYYEKAAFEKYCQEFPNKLPPKWPVGVQFIKENISLYAEGQRIIDQRLDVLRVQFIEISITTPQTELLLLAKEKMVEDSSALSDFFIQTAGNPYVVVSALKAKHVFQANTSSKNSYWISLQVPGRTKEIQTSDLMAPAFALLGSSMAEDKRALRAVLDSHQKLNLWVSNDFRCIDVSLEKT